MDDLSIAFKLNDQVITFWQFYVAWTAGVIDWVFYRESAWSSQKIIGIGLGVLIFNISGLIRTFFSLSKVMSAMRDEAYKLSPDVSEPVFQAALTKVIDGRLVSANRTTYSF